jgi:hypothetical protein
MLTRGWSAGLQLAMKAATSTETPKVGVSRDLRGYKVLYSPLYIIIPLDAATMPLTKNVSNIQSDDTYR